MHTRYTVSALIAVLVIASACDGDDVTPPSGEVDIRVVNASLTIQGADLRAGDAVVAQNIAFGPGQCIVIASGPVTLTFRANGQDLESVNGNLTPGTDYAVVLYDDGNEPAIGALVADLQTPGSGLNAIRFVNISGSNGDVFLTEPATDPGGTPTVDGLNNEQFTDFGAAPLARSVAWLFREDETTNPIASVTLPTLAQRVGTVVFVGAGAPGGQTALVFEPCPAS
jgi:hypothetical protein